MIRWTRNEDESIKRRGTRLSATCRRGWLTNYGYALRKRRARARYRNVDGKVSVSLSLGCDVVVVRARNGRTDAPKYPRMGEEDRRSRWPYPDARAAAGDRCCFFFSLFLAATLYSRPDNLRPLIYAMERSRTRTFFFARTETCLVRERTRSECETRVLEIFFFYFDTLFRGTCNNAEDCGLVTACHVVRTRLSIRVFFIHI